MVVMTASLDLLTSWRAEERSQPDGWDFSSLNGRMTESSEPWDFAAIYRDNLRDRDHVLDIGTGGGEYLLRFADLLPVDTVATEGWSQNVPVARANLAAYRIQVVEYAAPEDEPDSVRMPFADDRFDLVLNRHESYSALELARVIEPGGTFVTQQVASDECGELDEIFGDARPRPPDVRLDSARAALEAAGFEVTESAETRGEYVFDDVASLIAYWQLVSWETPDDFSVDNYAHTLLDLHRRTSGGPVRLTRKRFWLKAVRRP